MTILDPKPPGLFATWGPCVALAVASFVAAAAVSPAARPGGPVAALYPPWWSASHALAAAAAAGRPVRFGAVPFIVVLVPDTPDAPRREGAWLLFDPKALGGCTIL